MDFRVAWSSLLELGEGAACSTGGTQWAMRKGGQN